MPVDAVQYACIFFAVARCDGGDDHKRLRLLNCLCYIVTGGGRTAMLCSDRCAKTVGLVVADDVVFILMPCRARLTLQDVCEES